MDENMTNLIASVVSLVVSMSITGIVYNVMKSQVDNLRNELDRSTKSFNEQIKSLEDRLIRAQNNADAWFRKYHSLAGIIEDNGCTDRSCKIHKTYKQFQSKEGKVKNED